MMTIVTDAVCPVLNKRSTRVISGNILSNSSDLTTIIFIPIFQIRKLRPREVSF